MFLGVGQRGINNTAQEYASSTEQHFEGAGMAASASAENLYHNGAIEEGDRKGGGDYSACDYESINKED